MKPQKRKNSDIQILRAVAIAAVLGFHLLPELFPQGYLGVDIFFVISGYLMTLILDEKTFSFQECLRFYERRLKRLLPAYILVIFLTLAITSLFLISTDYDFLKYDTLWAMFFGTNFQSMFEKETYFKLISDYKFLLHTWSLAVEFQYYLLAPFILIPIAKSGNPVLVTTIISLLSFTFQILIPYQTLSFGLVFSRIWQFLMGTIVFHLQKSKTKYIHLTEASATNNDDVEALKTSNKQISTFYFDYSKPKLLIFFAIIGICFMPQPTDNPIYLNGIRFLSIILSGIAIYFGYQSNPSGKFVILQKAGIYIGNISYSLYLLHWPIIIFAKYQGFFNKDTIWIIFVVIIISSLIQYHCYETIFLRQQSKVVFSLVFLIYALLIVLLLRPQMKLGKVIHPAVAGNQKIAHECNALPQNEDCNWDPILLEVMNNTKPTKSGAHYCSYEGSGNLTIFFTGNSFALRQLAAVKKALNKMYKKLYYVARPACLTFEYFNIGYERYWQCDELMNKTTKFLEKLRPDILMISQKVSGNDQFKGRVNSIEVNDTTVVKLQEYFQLWSPYVKKIYHIEPHPTMWVNPATSMARELALGASVERHFLTLGAVQGRVGPGWWRIKSAMRSCPKCTPIEMNEAFVEDGKFFYHDRNTKLSYFCDNGHLSPAGADKMIPILRKVIREDFKGTV